MKKYVITFNQTQEFLVIYVKTFTYAICKACSVWNCLPNQLICTII